MGMFDNIRCYYPLPVDGASELSYQTQDTPAQRLDNYEIREDGSLWHQSVDYDEPPVLSPWVPCLEFTGEIRFYNASGGWIEWSAYFTRGHLVTVNLIENTGRYS